MRPQENNVWGTGSLRAWYKGEHHEAKPAREGAFLPRKARARVVPSNPGYSGYLRVLMGTHSAGNWVLMGAYGYSWYSYCVLSTYPPGTTGYPRVLCGYPRELFTRLVSRGWECGAGASTGGTVAKVHVKKFSNRPVPGFWVKYFSSFQVRYQKILSTRFLGKMLLGVKIMFFRKKEQQKCMLNVFQIDQYQDFG